MTERADITVDWGLSPRLIEVDLPSVELSNQDMHDTLNSNTLQPGVSDDSLENMDDDFTIDSAGKEDLGGGVEVGITSTLLNSQIAFGRTDPRTGAETISTASTDGQTVTAAAASFVTDSCQRGDWVINWTDRSITEILVVNGEGSLRCRTLSGIAGSSNLFNLNDVISVWEVAEAELLGGNTVALDGADLPINPLFTTFGRFATRSSSSSATALNQQSLNFAVYQDEVVIDQGNVTGLAQAGTVFPAGTGLQPVLDVSDAKIIAMANGLTRLRFRGNYTFLASDNVDDYILEAGGSASNIVLTAGVSTEHTILRRMSITGTFGGQVEIENCHLGTIFDLGSTTGETNISNSLLEPNAIITFRAGGSVEQVHFNNVTSESAGDDPIEFEFAGTGPPVTIHKYSGGCQIGAVSNSQQMSFDGDANLVLLPTCTDGDIVVRGDVRIDDQSTGTFNVNDQGTWKKLMELWARLGLDPNNPMTTDDDNNVVVGGMTITAVNTATETTQTRTGEV